MYNACENRNSFSRKALSMRILSPRTLLSLFLIIFAAQAAQDYPNALHISTRFYGAQRCGANVQSWIGHDSCHWQDSFFVSDATGGWHDCGDHVKFAQTGGYAAALLLHSYLTFPGSFPDDYSPAFSAGASNGIPDILDEAKYYTDYAVKMIDSSGKKLLYQVGTATEDHSSCSAPEYQTIHDPESKGGGTRKSFYVSDSGASNIAGLHAAVLAMMYMAYKDYDASYAHICLARAKDMYRFGNVAHKAQSSVGPDGTPDGTYTDTTWADDMAFGAIELFRATNDSSYLDDVINVFTKSGNYPFPTYFVLDYPNVSPLVEYEIAKHIYPTTANKNKLKTEADSYLDSLSAAGFAFFGDWGSLKYSAAASYVALLTTNLFPTDTTYLKFAEKNCNFILGDHGDLGGDAPAGFSFLAGYSAAHVTSSPNGQIHHAGAFAGEPGVFGDAVGEWGHRGTDNKHALVGAVVGGPTNKNGSGYNNYRNDAITNEVCIYYNAPFIGALAGIIEYNEILKDTTPPIAITNLTVDAVAKTNASFHWTASSSSDADSTLIGWGSSITTIAEALAASHVVIDAGDTTHIINGLTPNTTYTVAVFVKDKSGNWSTITKTTVTTDAIVTSNYVLDDFENFDYGLDVLNYSRGSWYLFDDQAPSWDQAKYSKSYNRYTDTAMLAGGNSRFTNFDPAYLEIHKSSTGNVLKMEQKYEEVQAKEGAGYDNSKGLELKFVFGDKHPHWGHEEDATYNGYVGFGTGLMPEGKFAILDETMAITFRAKASQAIDMEMALITNQPVIKRHGNHYKVKDIQVGTDWVEYTIPIKMGDGPNDFNQHNWWDADEELIPEYAFWGWEARNSTEFVQLIEEAAKFSQSEKIQWSFINDDPALVGKEITFWIDDITITNFAPTFDDQLSTSNWGYQALNPDSNKKEIYTYGQINRLSPDNMWYAYNDCKNRTDITNPATARQNGEVTDITALTNCSMNWEGYINPLLNVSTSADYPEVGYKLGKTFPRSIDGKVISVFPFMAIGMETRYNYYEHYDASSYNGVSFRYKTSGSNSSRYQLRLHDRQLLTAEGASFLINVPATGGQWKEITISFDDIALPWWDSEDKGKSFQRNRMTSIEFAIEGVPNGQGSIAVDDIYFVTNAQSNIPDINAIDTLPPYVAIKEKNQQPTNITLSNNTVIEKSPMRTLIGFLNTTDANSGDTHSYTEISDSNRVIISGDTLFTSEHFAKTYKAGDKVSVSIKSTDPFGAATTKTFEISVISSGTNHPPTDITLTPSTVAATAPEGTLIGILTTTDEDAGDTHTYEEFIKGSAKVTIRNDSVFTNSYFKATYSAGDTAYVTIKSFDNSNAMVAKTKAIVVTGTVPVNKAPTLSTVTPQTINEDDTLDITLAMTNAADEDGDALSIHLINGANYSTLNATVKPARNYNGTLTVPVYVSDGKLTSDTIDMIITINPVNDAPTLDTITPQTILEDNAITLTLAMTDAADIEGDALTIVPDTGADYTVSGATITPDPNFTGQLIVRTRVFDGSLYSQRKRAFITVAPVNDAPILDSVHQQAILEDTPLTLTLAMVTASDVENDALTIVPGAGTNYSLSGTTITPALNYVGQLEVPVKVSDGSKESATKNMLITVAPVNDAPTIDSIPALSVNEDDTLLLTLGMLKTTDVDGDPLSLTIHGGANYTVQGSFIIPNSHFDGSLSVLLEVSDSKLSDTAMAIVTVVDTGITVTVNKDSINHWVNIDTLVLDSTYLLPNKDTVKKHWEIEKTYDTTIWKIDTLHDAAVISSHLDTVALFSVDTLVFTSDTITHIPVLTVVSDTTLTTLEKSYATVDSAVSATLDTLVTTITYNYFEDTYHIKTDSLLDAVIFNTVYDTIIVERDTTIGSVVNDTLPYIPTIVITIDTTVAVSKDTAITVDSLVLQTQDTLVTTTKKELVETLTIVKTDTLQNPEKTIIGTSLDSSIVFDTIILSIETDTLFFGQEAILKDPSKITNRARMAPNPMRQGGDEVRIALPEGDGTYEVNILDPLGNILLEQYGDLSEEYVFWKGTNSVGIPVATGTYLVLIKETTPSGRVRYYKATLGVTE